MAYTHLLTRREGPVEYLTLNRPEVRNAFNETLIAEMSRWAEAMTSDTSVRVAVVAGAGPAFCAGGDMAWMSKMIGCSQEENLRDATASARMFLALDSLPIPLIARVHGAAIGGGAGLAAVCDIAIAEEQAVFGFTEVKLGIMPSLIAPYVVAKIGRSAARQLFLTGARFSAERARAIGLIHAVVDSGELDATVNAYVRECQTGGPEAIAAAKAMIQHIWNRPPADVMSLTAEAIAERRVSAEGQEGMKAFLEKRRPHWSKTKKSP